MPSEGAGEAVPSPLPRQASTVPRRPAADRPPLPRTVDGLPQLEPAFSQVVDAGLQRLGLELTAGGRSAIDAQARLLLAWSPFVNLTALRDAEQIARGHVLDSLTALPLLRRLAPRRLLDLGSGAGYPGLPLAACLPAADCALVDSVGKKQAFLSVAADAALAALREAGEQPPNILALAERAEDLAQEADQREAWDVTTARAVGSLAEVLELCLPLTRVGGHVVAWKRRPPDGSLEREMGAARRVLQAAGGSRPRLKQAPGLAQLGLPEHVLVVVRKVRPTPHHYPRPPAERRRALLR
ncbi:MAG TPA: RsmG family class I SAM-dependent methyltransferase [Candidatus Limnocylindria bacterium]|nr:RsmG family class I SAM-dependent methyltransferase [Candidatus Limnocylindria bacterium]